MTNKFRNEMFKKSNEFESIFNTLLKEGKIKEFDDNLLNIILKDKTPIKVNNEPLAFKDLFHQEITDGKCKLCTFEFVLLLDKLGIYSEAVYVQNDYFKGTTGSYTGGHWYVEAYFEEEATLIDTSLVVTGTREAFKLLGHNIVKKYDIDSLFKENSELIDYYDQMIIHK